MTDNSEYDALGELFRQRLEDHRMPVDDKGWDEIERRLGKGKSIIAIWSWRFGAMAAAASVAALLIFNRPENKEETVMVVSQKVDTEETGTANHETVTTTPKQETKEPAQYHIAKPAGKTVKNNESVIFQPQPQTNTAYPVALPDHDETENPAFIPLLTDSFIPLLTDSVIPLINYSVIAYLDADRFEEDEYTTKKTKKWMLAAAFGIGGYTDGHGNESKDLVNEKTNMPAGWKSMGSGNKYAAYMSGSIQSFSNMSRENFSNISHRPPFSFGLTARKNPKKGGSLETGLVYTYLASHFEWSGYNAHQSLHYLGIPVNLVVNLWNSKPNWRIYSSGGFTVEKGLRAIYRQERRLPAEHRITTVRSSIDGVQWSLNGGLGVSFALEKGWGIYFEPRVGYSFNSTQPISIRTEWPVYVGISMGLNYELQKSLK